jgi:large subunit ribosomal protein L20
MRVKRGVTSKAKHNKIFRSNKGYRMTKNRLIRVAKQAYLHAGEYAFAGRKNRKRDFRELWITRIGAAVREHGLSYSKFMALLKDKKIELNRKSLSYLITDEPKAFESIVDVVKKSK